MIPRINASDLINYSDAANRQPPLSRPSTTVPNVPRLPFAGTTRPSALGRGLPHIVMIGNYVLNVGPLTIGMSENQFRHLQAALVPADVQALPLRLIPDNDGVLSYEAYYPGQQRNDPRRMLVTLKLFDQHNLQALRATSANFNINPFIMEQATTPIVSAEFGLRAIQHAVGGAAPIRALATAAIEGDSNLEGLGPIGGVRPGYSLSLGGQEFSTRKTSDNGFTVSLHDAHSDQRRTDALAAIRLPFPAYTNQEIAEATRQLSVIKQSCLKNHPDQAARLNQQTAELASRLLAPGSHTRSELVDALAHYQAPDGDHVLMNIALQGHQTLSDYLRWINPQKYGSEAAVDEFCEHFIDTYSFHEYESQDLKNRYKDEIRNDVAPLMEFLNSSEKINGVSVVKGVKTNINMERSTAVEMASFVGAFLNQDKIYYNSFLSTSADWDESAAFTGGYCPGEHAVLAVDLFDPSSEAMSKRARLLNELAYVQARDEDATIMMVLNCKNAKGVVIDSATLGLGDTLAIDEQEILLAPNHVIHPQKVIRTQDGYVLVGEVTHVAEH